MSHRHPASEMGKSAVKSEKKRTASISTMGKQEGKSAEGHCFLCELSKASIMATCPGHSP